jgi:hypothetical protein
MLYIREAPSVAPGHDAWHVGGLVLVTIAMPVPAGGPRHSPVQTSPNPTAAEPGDGRVRSRPSSHVDEPCTFPDAVASGHRRP